MASIKQRGEGSWRICVSCGYDDQGKQRRITRTVHLDPRMTLKAQQKEAERQAAALETDYNRGLVTDSRRVSLNELFDDYLQSKEKLSATTAAGYTWLYNDKIKERLGTLAVQDISKQLLQRFFTDLSRQSASARSRTGKLSGNSRKHYFTLLRALFNYAVRMGIISVSPMNAIEPPPNDAEETSFYEPGDLARLLDCLEAEPLIWRTFFSLAIYTGARPGELIGADWSDYDGDSLTIRAGAARVDGETVRTARPKTRASERTIDLPPEMTELLDQWRVEQQNYRDRLGEWSTNAIFSSVTGKRMDLSSPTQRFQKVIKKNDLPPITLYGLRHSHASILIAGGLDVRSVAARMGHSQTSTTLNIYSHQFQRANSIATQAISAALSAASEKQKIDE